MQVIGLDIGTSGVKSTLFDGEANVLGFAHREYDLIGRERGEFELDPTELREKAFEVLRESAQGAGDVQAICMTSFGESFVCLDEADKPLCNTMIYMDKRGSEECEEYKAYESGKGLMDRSGQYFDPMFSMFKLRWLHKHRPEVISSTKKLCFIADYLAYCLGARHECDYSLSARSGLLDVYKKEWMPEAIAFTGVAESIFPKPVPGGSVIGTLSDAVADRLGINPGAKLIIGGHDQIMAALGSGAWAPGDVANGMGTTDCLTVVMDAERLDGQMLRENNFPVVPFSASDNYVTYAWNMSGGCIVKWFRDTLGKDIAGEKNAYDLLGTDAPDAPTGIIVLPFLGGGGTPYMDSTTPGVVAGLKLGTSRGKLFKAFLEGESCEMRINLETLEQAGIEVSKVITVGGGAKSGMWMQLRADLFSRPIELPEMSEAGLLASAMLCYVGIGLYNNIQEAQRALVRVTKAYHPQPGSAALYEKQYQRYKTLYQAVKEIYQND